MSRNHDPLPLAGGKPPTAELGLQDLLGLLVRRKALIFTVFSIVVVAAIVLFATAQRLYLGSAEIQVQKQSADALSLNTMMGQSDVDDALLANIELQTEARVLESKSLALSVIDTLHLEHSADLKARFNPLGWLLGKFSPAGTPDQPDVPLDEAPARRSHAIKAFEERLKVKPVAGTRLISVEYYSNDPETAAAVVNLLVHDLINFNFTTRHDATERASGWLTQQLSDLRKQSEDLQARVVTLQHDSGVFALGQTDTQGREQVYTPAMDRLQQATSQLADAESARIMKGALYQVVRDGNPELISGLAGNTLAAGTPGFTNSLTLLQNLREQEAETNAQFRELSAKFGPAYPKVVQVQASLNAIRGEITAEANRIAARVQNDYIVAQKVESDDRTLFNQEKGQAEALNDKAVQYEIVRQEAEQSSTLYENLLQRLKEADLVAGLHSSNITLVDEARAPSRPAKPALLLYAAVGIGAALVLSLAFALLRDATDSRIQNFADLGTSFYRVPIGILPGHSMQKARKLMAAPNRSQGSLRLGPEVSPPLGGMQSEYMVAAYAPRAAYTEALRALRTSLMQSGVGQAPPQVLLITSSIPGEGKSMMSLNLAIVYAQRGKKVLLVDGDLRTPTLEKRLSLSIDHGLSDLLLPGEDAAAFSPSRIPLEGKLGLDVLTAGRMPAYPAEMLSSDEMVELVRLWRTQYDYILIDGAPVLPVTDSAILARYADFTLVVARHNKTDRRSLDRTYQILHAQGVRNLGVVLNDIRADSSAQYLHYGYNPTAYYGSKSNA